MTNSQEMTTVNMYHFVVGNYSSHILVRDRIQGMGKVPQTEIKTQERMAPSTTRLNRINTKLKKHSDWKGREMVASSVTV
jgi:hypothetical protein